MAGSTLLAPGDVPSLTAGLTVVAVAASVRPQVLARARRPAPPGPGPDRPTTDRPHRARPARHVGAVATTGALVAAAGWFAGAAAIVAIVAWRVGRRVAVERRARRSAHRAFPDAVDRIVLLVRAGLTPHQAVRDAAHSAPPTIGPAFEEIVHRLDRGLPLGEALAALPELLGPRAASLADAFAAADRYGLPLEPMLDQLAGDARAERRRLDEADARRLPVRMTFPLVACTLPAFVLVAIAPALLAALSSLGATW